MWISDGVIIGKPLFYGKTNDIVVFEKISNFFWYNCRKLHLKDDSTVLSEGLNMDTTWALLRMKLARLMKRGISPGNMPQIFSWGGYQSILNSAVLRLWKYRILSHDRRLRYWFYHCVYSLETCTNVWWCLETEQCRNHVWCGHLHPSKANSNEVSRRIFKHGGSSWKITHRTEILSMLGKKFRFYVSDLGNISVYGLVVYIRIFFNDFG